MRLVSRVLSVKENDVWGLLEYHTDHWSLQQAYIQDELQRIQDKFLRMVGVRLEYDYHTVPKEMLAA
ncbi:hypothetical protein J6590_054703 [Homalodisca vitripennis]|nr:hypothetical protein J6590_054703 [Homalodisca vitripennis]